MKSQDFDTLLSLVGDDVTVTCPGDSQIAGTARGKEEMMGVFGLLGQLSEGTYNFDIRAIASTDGIATAVGRATASARGKDLDQEVVHVLDIEDGRVSSLNVFFGDQAMTDAFWA